MCKKASRRRTTYMQVLLAVGLFVSLAVFSPLGSDDEPADEPIEEIVVIGKRLGPPMPLFFYGWRSVYAAQFPVDALPPPYEEGNNRQEDEEEANDRIGCWRELTDNANAPLSGTYDEKRANGKHLAIDVAVVRGTKVYAAQSGEVSAVVNDMKADEFSKEKSTGNYVAIGDSQGRTHRYLHLETVSVKKGDQVGAGDSIGTANNTGYSFGNHLHYDLSDSNGVRIDPEQEFDCDEE